VDRLSKVLHQFLGDVWTFQPHYTFLRTPIAQKIDASVPDDSLVYDGKFLMDVSLEQKVAHRILYAGTSWRVAEDYV
jgi:hypothetical protein